MRLVTANIRRTNQHVATQEHVETGHVPVCRRSSAISGIYRWAHHLDLLQILKQTGYLLNL